tara:strand:+ start:1322 stop:1570 length:249 start_codon:yes stop_codon:yes gene_type:complete
MNLIKDLKKARFTWSGANKKLTIRTEEGELELDKTYCFSLMRFILRISQKNFTSQINNKAVEATNEDLIIEDERQETFYFYE